LRASSQRPLQPPLATCCVAAKIAYDRDRSALQSIGFKPEPLQPLKELL
jgi:hypothetical protein